jgi:tRNA-uridine 2-sulfurtransferase
MNNIKQGSRIVVGMSGGVDSCVAAALLVEQDFDVIGVTIKTYDYAAVGGNDANESSCCSLDGINDARQVCAQLGIPHYVLDFSDAFHASVIDPFIGEYLAGNTPNPCVLCNKTIKWEELIKKGLDIGADAVAMGHYARIGYDPSTGRRWISKGKDSSKDQSYALWMLTQDSLAKTVFPLGDMTKEEARAYAVRKGLRTAAKRESYEICFIPDNNYARFLRERVEGLEENVRGGALMLDGKIIGRHEGYPFYTIGQRRGLNIAVGEPLYVTGIDAEQNIVHVGSQDRLLHRRCALHSIAMQKHPLPPESTRVHARIRYKDEGAPATVEKQSDGSYQLVFDQPRRAITPGQSTVWYEGDDVVGGAVIAGVLE